MLHDLALYALGVAALCAGKVLVRCGVTALFRRLVPGPARRGWQVEVGSWTLTVTLSRKEKT